MKQSKKERFKNEWSLSDPWDNFSQPNIPVIVVPEGQWGQVEKNI